MKTLLAILAIFSASVSAAPPTPAQLALMQHMVSQCNSVMGREVCTVMLDASRCDGPPSPDACKATLFRAKYPNGIIVPGPDGGRFTAGEYFLYQGAGLRMCEVIVQQCSVDYDGRGCLMGRTLWRQR